MINESHILYCYIKGFNTCAIINANPFLFINSNAKVISMLSVLSFSRAITFSSTVPLLSLAKISLAVFDGENSNRRILPFFTSFLFFSVM